MKIFIDERSATIEPRKITIILGDVEFDIRVNQFNEIVINKGQFGDAESAINIKPTVSNEIRIS